MGPTDKPTAIVYIDGFNLYYGALKARPHLRWLDLEALANLLIPDDHEIQAVRYFTARVADAPHASGKARRQSAYLRALTSLNKVETQFGVMALRRHRGRLVIGGTPTNRMVQIETFEEKGTDVNLAASLVLDALSGSAELFTVISDDTDLAGPVQTLRELGKNVTIASPRGLLLRPFSHPDFRVQKIRARQLELAQLDDRVRTSTGIVYRPSRWR